MKPSFLVIGAQKCATSSLCDMLGRHPDVFTPDPREPNFFSHADVWRQGWDWYESLFAGAEGVKAIGEGSTAYTMQARYPETAPRIARHLPEARLIYIVRDPLERMVSHWMHMRARGNREKLPFNEAVRNDSWYLDNDRIVLCPETCVVVEADPAGEIEVHAACEGPTID